METTAIRPACGHTSYCNLTGHNAPRRNARIDGLTALSSAARCPR